MPVKDDSVELPPAWAMMFAITEAREVYREFGADLIITSGSERTARHSRTSLHYAGQAVDIRTKHLDTRVQREQVRAAIAARLNKDFDVLLEDEGGHNEHIHIEYQPERR